MFDADSKEPPELVGYTHLLPVDPSTGHIRHGASILVPTALATKVNEARRCLEVWSDSTQAWTLACVRRAIDPEDAQTGKSRLVVQTTPGSKPAPALMPAPAPVPATTGPVAGLPTRGRKRRSAQGHWVPVLRTEELQRRRKDLEVKLKLSAAERKAEEKLLDDLLARSQDRLVGLKKDWRVLLRQLATDMPNFAQVIDRIEGCCALAQFTRTPLRIPALLLAGSPGVGKTHFAKRLAGLLGVPQFVYALESAETASVLCGAEKHWSNAEPGVLYNLVVLGQHANPVVVLDELDKAPRGAQYKPANALHAILEPVTACQLRDKCIDLAFDASYVVYIATANRLGTIEPSLRSRFELFLIEEPEPRASLAIARSIGRQVLAELNLSHRMEAPAGEVVQQLALLGGPRQMHKVLRAALARAVNAGRTRVTVEDLVDGPGRFQASGGGDGRVH